MNLTQRIVTAMLLGLICGALLNAIFSFDLLLTFSLNPDFLSFL